MPSNTVIQTNVLSLNATRNLGKVGGDLSKASARLSSGLRVNSAADDAAGLAISEKMRSQIRGLDQASRNAQDGQALAKTAEGGMEQMSEMGQRIRELLVQGANDTNTSTDRAKIAGEISQLQEEFTAMADRVQYNNKTLLNGEQSGGISLQVGANKGQMMKFSINDMSAKALGIDGSALNVSSASTADDFSSAIDKVDSALANINSARAQLGAIQNRLDYTNNSLQISSENLSNAESRVRDADMAKEMMTYTSANVKQQAAISMLSQANQAPNNVLSLLR